MSNIKKIFCLFLVFCINSSHAAGWFGIGLDDVAVSINDSIFNKNNLPVVAQRLAYSCIGTALGIYGVKTLYSACEKLFQKLDVDESDLNNNIQNKKVTRSDYGYILAGIAIIGCGMQIIAKS